MAIKKSQLYSSIWKSCDELRGSMDASQYKDYILVILFVKYLTDKYYGKKNQQIEVPDGASFHDMIKLKGKPNIGEGINKIISKLAEECDLGNLTKDANFDDSDKLGSGKAKVEKLSKIVGIFQNDSLDFSKNKAEGDDIIGDAYEYLMRNFATQSGKSKGQFYTPAEVSRIIAKVVGTANAKIKSQTVYDPTCGSGSLLLKAHDESPNGLTIYGQEKDLATSSMAKMNMFIHNAPLAVIKNEDTISSPQFIENEKLKTFDFAVANPPFSDKAWSTAINEENDTFERFDGFAVPPRKNGDYAYLLHMLKSLKPNGKGAIVLPHGVLFRGNAEAVIRKKIIERGWIKGIIGLPSNLFYGTGIPACIVILDKENAEDRKEIFMMDASKNFIKDGNKNRLQAKDIHKIVDVFTNQIEIPKFSRLIPLSEISNEKNDFNLNITRYIDSQEEEDIQDIDAHLNGGIPESDIDNLEKYWRVYPSLQEELFSPNKRKGYLDLKIEKSEIQNKIFTHKEFEKFTKSVIDIYEKWKIDNYTIFDGIKVDTNPKELIHLISEDLLKKFLDISLIDRYDIYQYLMSYWEETMQDDVYLIAQNGWNTGKEITPILFEKGKNKGKVKDWYNELIPKELMIEKYFSEKNDKHNQLIADSESLNQEMDDMEEEYANGDDGDVFGEVRGKSGKIAKGEIDKRIKIIKNDTEFEDEFEIIKKYLEKFTKKADVDAEIKSKEKEMEKKLVEKYKKLTTDEIKKLVVNDKWLSSLSYSINEELEKLSHKLTNRMKELVERYEDPLPGLENENQSLTENVHQHLGKIGFKW
tara:strand:+ start:95 stop:2527 length:2433 start_codon:yes stop_codon:yes gene_type:complete